MAEPYKRTASQKVPWYSRSARLQSGTPKHCDDKNRKSSWSHPFQRKQSGYADQGRECAPAALAAGGVIWYPVPSDELGCAGGRDQQDMTKLQVTPNPSSKNPFCLGSASPEKHRTPRKTVEETCCFGPFQQTASATKSMKRPRLQQLNYLNPH